MPQELLTADYLIGPIKTTVSATSKRFLDGVDEVAALHRTRKSSIPPDIQFFVTGDEQDNLSPKPLDKRARPVFQCRFFSFWEYESWRWLELPGQALGWCDLEDCFAVASVNPDIDSPWLIGHHLFFPLWVQMLKQTKLYHVHAACVARDNKGLLLPGPSGCGKTTLALNMVRNGYSFLADDTIFLSRRDEGHIVTGLAEQINVGADTIAQFQELDFLEGESRPEPRPKLSFQISDVYQGCRSGSDVAPSVIVFPHFTGDFRTNIQPMSRADALISIMHYSLLNADHYSITDQFKILADLVEKVPCYRADIGIDNEDSVFRLAQLLEETDSERAPA